MPVIRRLLPALCVLVLTAGCSPGALPGESPATSTGTDNAKADAVMSAVREVMASEHLKAAIVRVTVDGQEIVTEALGESMTGVPADTNMHFRNGAVAISYVSTLLLKLVDEQKVSLDDKLSKFLPEIPHADRVTLGQLAQMTSGYVDYVIGNTKMNDAAYANPFRRWTVHELLQYAVDQPLLYEPGTNWNYAHTNYLLLGLALEKATGEEMPKLLSEKILRPLGLTNTVNSLTPEIPAPALHAFSSERREFLKIPPGTPFYEESTFWDPSWTITHGAIQTTDIYDMEATAVGIGSGRLLSAGLVQEDGVHRPARQDPQAARLHHVRRDDRGVHLRYGPRHLRQLVASEPADVGVLRRWRPTYPRRRLRSLSRSRTCPRRSTTRATTATARTPCSARSEPLWPPMMRPRYARRNNVSRGAQGSVPLQRAPRDGSASR